MLTIDDFHRACNNIIDNSDQKALNWAVNYAAKGLMIFNRHEAKIQSLYILNNITHWRGDVAKETRQTLKTFIKEVGS